MTFPESANLRQKGILAMMELYTRPFTKDNFLKY